MSLCHSVFPEPSDKGILYQGASPDDIALVKGSQQLGIEFTQKNFQDIYVRNNIVNNHLNANVDLNNVNSNNYDEYVYEVKAELPFDSDRKRMSTMTFDKQRNKYIQNYQIF